MWCLSIILGDADNLALKKTDIDIVYSSLIEAGKNYSENAGYSIYMIRTLVYLLFSLYRY